MEVRNGHKQDNMEFSNLDSAIHANTHEEGATRGPWTHSTDSYSRKLHNAQESKTVIPKKTHCMTAFVCIIIFIVGVGLGIINGVYGIKSNDNITSSEKNLPSTEKSYAETTTASDISSSTSAHAQCVCSTLPSVTSTPKPECDACSMRNPDSSTGSESLTSAFAALTRDEIDKAITTVINNGIASYGNSLSDNRISHVYLFPVEKSKVLEFLDDNGKFPGRFAKVHVYRGERDPPDVMEYKVGPLHVAEDTITIEQLRNDGDIEFNRRPFDRTENRLQYQLARPHFNAMKNLLMESFDGKYYQDGIFVNFAFLPSYNTSDRVSTAFLYLQMGGYSTIRILPVTCKMHHPGTDPSKWRVSDFYYLSQGPYESGQALQEAYNSGKLRKITYPLSYFDTHNREFDLKMNSSLPPRPYSDLPPPQSYEPEGPRYTLKGSRISWMGWEFDFTSDAIRGPAIFDVRFQGSRIAYEISLQDVTLLYASQTNGAGPPALSDTLFFLGNSNPPRLGLDCPKRAKLLHLSMFVYDSIKEKAYACVFEADGQEAAWKYQSLGINNHYLVVRAPMNLGNYEYSVEWRLYLDGHLETLISASGFLYGAFWDEGDALVDSDKSSTPFGFRLAKYMLGPIHDHAYAFKVDVDILGVNNSFEILHWKAGDVLSALRTQTNATEVPGYFPFNNTRYIQYELLEREGGFVLNPLKPKYFTVVNENERNFWGVKRGYRIVPHSQGAENFDDHVMFGPWGHLKYNVAVSQRKDSELYATNSIYDIFQPLNSFQGVSRMINNETIRDKDLVLWVTEKFFHAPSAEDLPMTLKVNRGFTLQPYNYFDRTPTFDVRGFYANSPGDEYTIESCYISKP